MKPFEKMLGYFAIAIMALSLAGANCGKQEGGVTASPGFAASVSISEVSVPSADKVDIRGNAMMDAEVVLLSENPPVLAVEIEDATLAEEAATTVSGKGAISSVTAKQIGGMDVPVVRVTVSLNRDMTYRLVDKPNGVTLNIEPKEQGAGGAEPLPYDEARSEVERQISGRPAAAIERSGRAPSAYSSMPSGTRPKAPFLAELPPSASDGAATVIGDVYFRSMKGNDVQVMIYTNGPVKNYVDFNLMSPPRIVVDLYGVDDEASKENYYFKWGRIKKVRVGQHMEKTRVVIDLKGKLPAYQVESTYTGIVVTLFDYDFYREVKGSKGECLPDYPCDRSYETTLPNFSDYETGKGESFRSIAEKEYGNPQKWLTIFTANREAFTRKEREAIKESNGALELGDGLDIKIPIR